MVSNIRKQNVGGCALNLHQAGLIAFTVRLHNFHQLVTPGLISLPLGAADYIEIKMNFPGSLCAVFVVLIVQQAVSQNRSCSTIADCLSCLAFDDCYGSMSKDFTCSSHDSGVVTDYDSIEIFTQNCCPSSDEFNASLCGFDKNFIHPDASNGSTESENNLDDGYVLLCYINWRSPAFIVITGMILILAAISVILGVCYRRRSQTVSANDLKLTIFAPTLTSESEFHEFSELPAACDYQSDASNHSAHNSNQHHVYESVEDADAKKPDGDKQQDQLGDNEKLASPSNRHRLSHNRIKKSVTIATAPLKPCRTFQSMTLAPLVPMTEDSHDMFCCSQIVSVPSTEGGSQMSTVNTDNNAEDFSNGTDILDDTPAAAESNTAKLIKFWENELSGNH